MFSDLEPQAKRAAENLGGSLALATRPSRAVVPTDSHLVNALRLGSAAHLFDVEQVLVQVVEDLLCAGDGLGVVRIVGGERRVGGGHDDPKVVPDDAGAVPPADVERDSAADGASHACACIPLGWAGVGPPAQHVEANG